MDLLFEQPWYIISLAAFGAYLMSSYIICLTAYLLFYKLFRGRAEYYKIQKLYTSKNAMTYELKYSFFTILIHSMVGMLIPFFYHKGYTLIYLDISVYGWLYFPLSIVIMILMHDAYFYWTHRLMHLEGIFKIVHRVHHRSINPSPWAAFSTHPIESFIASLIFPIIVFGIPTHWLALSIFILYMIFMNVMGHAGFEFFSHSFLRSWVGRLITTATHHNYHHKYFKGNYGIYFNFWDRLMKTERADYTGKVNKEK